MKALLFTGALPNYAATMALGRASRSAFWGPLSCLAYRDIPEPKAPGPDWAVVRTCLAGICGSDIHTILLQTSPSVSAFTSFPFVLGHENVGYLDSERVVVDPLLPCATRGIDPPCEPCRRGDFAHCENFAGGNISPGILIGGCRDTGGTWAPAFLAHKSQIFPVPGDMPDEAAVLVEPFAVALHAVARGLGGRTEGDLRPRQVLVVGGGIIGLATLAALRYWMGDPPPSPLTPASGAVSPASGTRIVALVRHEHQADLARSLGADEVEMTRAGWEKKLGKNLGADLRKPIVGREVPTRGADIVFECAGSASALDTSLRFAAPGGRVVLVGLAASPKGIDWSFIWRKELDLIGTFCSGEEDDPRTGERRRTFDIALDLLRSRSTAFAGLVTHKFPLADYKRALRTVLDKGSSGLVKAVFGFPR